VKSGKRKSAMMAALEGGETGIFFESPHRIVSTLEILVEIAPEAKICVARELTKKFETYHRGTASELLEWFKAHGTKGEMVILMNSK
jgi:16S rRNA (cytidine1402-2'-O)-methyltransferase